MGTIFIFLNVFLIFIIFTQQYVAADDEEDMCECIAMMANEDAEGPDDIPILVDLSIAQVEGEGDGPDQAYLTGEFDVTADVPADDALTLDLTLVLLGPNGKETVWSISSKLCEMLEKDEDPLKDFSAIFGGKCPIPKGLYKVDKFVLNLDFLSEYLTEDWLGKYVVSLTIKKALDVYLDLQLGAVVDYMKRKCEKCPEDRRRK